MLSGDLGKDLEEGAPGDVQRWGGPAQAWFIGQGPRRPHACAREEHPASLVKTWEALWEACGAGCRVGRQVS